MDKPISILLVDDDAKNLMVLETILEAPDYRLVKASTAQDALLAVMQGEFAAIVLDVQMPDLNGIELARLIKQRKKSQHIPILFLTAYYQEDEHVVLGYDAGAVDYITKPVNPAVLRSKVGVFIDLFRAEAGLRAANAELAEKNTELQRQADDRARRIHAEAATAEAEAARERSAFLAEASNVLAASFDYRKTFARLAKLLVPKFAECCMVDLVGDHGALEPIVIAHQDRARKKQLVAFRAAHPRNIADSRGVAVALKTGRPLLCPDFDEQQIATVARSEEEAKAIRSLGIGSYLIIPLQARGRTLGRLCLASSKTGHFDEHDIPLAEELAQRAGLALDNARLYHDAAEAREAAEAANSAKDRFLAMLSHELRTPLSPVLHAVTLLEGEDGGPPKMRETLATIRRNVQLEARLIDDLLDLARIRNGKLQLHLEVVDAHDLLHRAVEICEPEIAGRGLRLAFDLHARRHLIKADPARIQQIFWNLINNAVKYTPPGGQIGLRTMDDDASGQLRVEVSDTGIGIQKDRIGKIFDAFEQAHGDRSSGLGLGLAICRALTELHGGRIEARSSGDAQGSTFSITLPAATATRVAVATTSPESSSSVEPPLRLLLVEDHPDTCATLERLLTRRGYLVRTAASVAAASDLLQAAEFDVLVSDIGLPDGSGLELMPKFTDRAGARRIGGIALSGFGMPEDLERSRAAGFSEHLIKPVDFSQLHQALARIGETLELKLSPALTT